MNENEIVIINTEYEISVEQVGSKGDTGDNGLSAYQVWLNLGNIGTEQDFINSLTGPKGDDGDNGSNGLSAYQVWLNLGNLGTEQDFINSLKGQKGDNGNDGVGVVAGGTTGQVLTKKSNTNFDTEWTTPSGGGGTTLTAGYNVVIDSNNKINVGTNTLNTSVTTIGLNADTKKGNWNTVFGYNALSVSLSSNPNYENTAFGYESLFDSNGVRQATAIGLQSQQSSGNDAQGNTSLGYQSLVAINGSLNTAVGHSAGGYNNFNNSSMLGYNAQVTGSNQVQLGNSSTNTYVYGTVQSRSDKRDKIEINDIDNALDFLMLLKPKTYKFNYREDYYDYENYQEEVEVLNEETQLIEKETITKTRKIEVKNDGSRAGTRTHSGLIAQDVKEALDLLNIDLALYQDHSINNGEDIKSLGYDGFIAFLIKAIQEQQEQINELKNEVNILKK